MSRNYKFHNVSGLYFVSFATVYWLDVFIRQPYFEVLTGNIRYCRANKGLELYAYCIMPSHACPELGRRMHLVFRSTNEDPAGLLRDFKSYSAKKMIETIENNPQESRKEYLLWFFNRAAKKNGKGTTYQFWQHHNKPIELWSPSVIKQKACAQLDWV